MPYFLPELCSHPLRLYFNFLQERVGRIKTVAKLTFVRMGKKIWISYKWGQRLQCVLCSVLAQENMKPSKQEILETKTPLSWRYPCWRRLQELRTSQRCLKAGTCTGVTSLQRSFSLQRCLTNLQRMNCKLWLCQMTPQVGIEVVSDDIRQSTAH